MNKFREVEPQEQPEKETRTRNKRPNKITRSFLDIFSGNFLSKEYFISQLPFILFLTGIALAYIANGYYAEKSVREISRITSELKELKSEFITAKSELMFSSNQSEVARAAASLGLKESTVPPKKIVVKLKEKNKNGD